MSNSYGEDSIRSLGKVEAIRMRPASIGIHNHEHTFIEILANAIDEFKEGFGDVIRVVKKRDYTIVVQDFGRGVPLDKNSEGVYNWELVFDRLWSGGKYNNNDDNANYMYSLGINGLGATGTNYTSDFLIATSYRNGFEYQIEFEKGIVQGELFKKEIVNSATGTIIYWKPSKEVFGEDNISTDFIKKTLEQQAVINGGLKFEFYNEETDETFNYYYEKGIVDFINELCAGKNITDIKHYDTETSGSETEGTEIYKAKLELAFVFTNDIGYTQYYHNSSWLENGGTPETAVKLGFAYAIDKYAKDNGKYNKNEKKIGFDDIADNLIVVSSTFSTIPLFTDQTKKTMKSKMIQSFMSDYIKRQLEVYFIENKDDAEKIVNQCLLNKRSREKADVNRQKIRKELEGQMNTPSARPEKFVACRSKDREKRRLVLIEGDSALNAVKSSRDAYYDAIFPLKGKPINCLKKNIDDIMKNEEVKNIIKLIGAGVTYKGKAVKGLPKFELGNIQFSEIDILSDADEDGFHIRTLLIGLFYMLMPDMIKYRKIKILEAPLYYIKCGNNEYIAYDEMERNDILRKIKGKFEEKRYKGLGGINTQLMAKTVMNIENRRIKEITMDDVSNAVRYLEMFLDDDSSERRQYISEHGDKYFDYSLYED